MKKYLILLFSFFLFAYSSASTQKNLRKSKKMIVSERSNLVKESTSNYVLRAEGKAKEVVLQEDFSKFTLGSENKPDSEEISDFYTGLISDQFTQVYGWTGAGVFQAGGCCYIDIVDFYDEKGDEYKEPGYINTPGLILSYDEGRYKVKFKARSSEATGDSIYIGSINEDRTYEFADLLITNKWQEYEVDFKNGAYGTYIQFYTKDFTFFLDDIEVSMDLSELTELPAPVVLFASNIADETFTANWVAVDRATYYLLDVYTYEDEEQKEISDRKYLIQDEVVADTKCKLENVTPYDVQYYYVVRAVNGEIISEYSEEMKVEETIKEERKSPKLLPASNIHQSGSMISFDANWEGMDGINIYYFYLLETYTAKENEEFVVAYEDFEKVTQGTMDKPVEGDLVESLDNYTNSQGWLAVSPGFAKGMICVFEGEESELDSPLYDLSAGDGKFTVEFTAHSTIGNTLSIGKGCEIEPAVERTERYMPKFEKETQTFQLEFNHFNKNATGGIYFSVQSISHRTFIDEIKITKQLQAGDSVSYIYDTDDIHHSESTPIQSINIQMEPKPGYTYSYTVAVMKVGEGPYGVAFYGFDERMQVNLPITDSSKDNMFTDFNAYVNKDNLHISLSGDSMIQVYSLSGTILYSLSAKEGETILPLVQKGVYIVKAGDKTVKVIR